MGYPFDEVREGLWSFVGYQSTHACIGVLRVRIGVRVDCASGVRNFGDREVGGFV